MKKIILALMAVFTLYGCANSQSTDTRSAVNSTPDEVVEVLYFHGKQRCITCNAIEKLTKEVVENDFAQQVNDGKIIFKVIDISTKAGEKTADSYEVTWSSLFINKWKDAEESKNNMTDFAFSYAKNSPDIFKAGVKKKIDELLN